MHSERTTHRLLGTAFLIQAIASAVVGFFLLEPLLSSGDMIEIMTRIANNPLQLRAAILVEMITAMGIVMLGSMMYQILKKQNQNLALVAMGLYIFEAAILAASRIPALSLLHLSQEAVQAGFPDNMQLLGSVFIKAQSIGYDLHMLPFALGATIFYALFYKSGLLPKWLSILGIIAAPLALIGMLLVLLGVNVPILIFLPNLPFELSMGVWFLVFSSRQVKETA